MPDRKHMKESARRQVKKHYVVLTVLCAISVFFGTEFTGLVSSAQIYYDALTGQITEFNIGMLAESYSSSDNKVIDDLIDDNLNAGRDNAAEKLEALKDSTDPTSPIARRKGILAALANSIESGQLTMTFAFALHSIIHSGTWVAVILIAASFLATAFIWIFIRNIYRAILRRAFLETRTYDVMPLSHLVFLKNVRRWRRAALTLLLTSIYQWLWLLTVVGGVIKYFSYFLVPFIVAENPDILPREAISLSRRMMNGHKWELFKLEVSFFGWRILGFFTFGLTEVLWSLPYRVAAYTEFYAAMREAAKAQSISGAERLNDDLLYAPAEDEALKEKYADIISREDLVDEDIVELKPVQSFFARNFGLWTATIEEKKVYSRQNGLREQMRVGELELGKKAYPQRLYPLWDKEAAALTGKISYLAPLTIWALIIVFFSFGLIGWLWEVSLHLIKDGVFVNRGVMHGPWLPIYGGGVALISVLLYRFRRNPAIEALTVVVLCGFVEYMTSFYLEHTMGMHWWDYTGYYLNLHGRICAEGLAVFCLGGMAAVYLLVPVIDGLVTRIKPKILIPICLVLLICFGADMVYSHYHPNTGEGITDYEDITAVEQAEAEGQS